MRGRKIKFCQLASCQLSSLTLKQVALNVCRDKNDCVVEAGKEQKGHFSDVIGAPEDFDFAEDENEPSQFFGRLCG